LPEIHYSKRSGDRREGRQLRSLPADHRLSLYLRRRRCEALCSVADTVEVTSIEQWLREKRNEGWSGLGFLHLITAAYVRTVSMRPGINRFVAARRLFARSDIQVVLAVRRGASADSPPAYVKVSFSPADTVFDVYRRISSAMDEVQADAAATESERISGLLTRLPRPLLRLVTAAARVLDYFDWLPLRWLDASPWHASLRLIDMGTLGVLPVDSALPDVGTLSSALSFGAKRKVTEADASGLREYRYVDYRITVDSRVEDSRYFSSALKCLKYFLRNPALLELPPEKIEDDVN
jgi:hypothetical protein